MKENKKQYFKYIKKKWDLCNGLNPVLSKDSKNMDHDVQKADVLIHRHICFSRKRQEDLFLSWS